MALRDFRISRSLVMSGVAVCATVGICVGTLLFLRPWPEHRAADTMLSPAEASIHAPGSAQDGPDLRAQAFNADHWPETTGRSNRLDTPVASPLEPAADKQDVAATADDAPQSDDSAPEGEKLAALTSGASDAPPVHTGATPKLSTPMSKAEVDDALKPLLSYDMSDEDVKNLKEAIRLVQKDEFTAARLYMAKLRDSGAQNLATWYAYRSGAYDASAWDIAEFRETSKLWPNRDQLGDRVEDALFWRETNPRKVLDYFREHRPASGPGKAALGNALIASGKIDEGTALIREAWRQHLLTPAIESKLKDVHGDRLRAEDHKARLDWLFVKNRKSDLKAIDRLVPLVDKKWEKAVQAQIATLKGDKNAGTLLSKLDDEVRTDPAILLARIGWARRNDKDDEAVWDLLRAAPTDSRKLINPMSWWDYRETQVRTALNAGQPKIAYSLAQGYGGELPAEELSDAEFLAGWIALRFLDDAKTAHKHLLASAAAGGLPKHRARASYWLGRTELALGNKRNASARFADAAQYTHTFYGQLSRQIAEPKATQFALRPYARPTAADIRSFTRNPVMRAMAAANKAGLEGLVPVFLTDLARSITSAPEMTLLCETAERVTGPHRAVRIAKVAMNRGFPVERYAYPDVLPEFKMLASKNDTEEALIHALTRQESEFNPTIVSSAGAMGLMQLLPSTAKEVARAHDIKFDKKKLNDPGYNLQLGSAFLHRLISSYNGSYVMALAAYNAGPGRVRTWIGQFGDPRDKKTDPIDWIERIPFKETREYVLKIMESAQVYRARLNRNGDSLRLAQDLHRGRPDSARTVLEAGMH